MPNITTSRAPSSAMQQKLINLADERINQRMIERPLSIPAAERGLVHAGRSGEVVLPRMSVEEHAHQRIIDAGGIFAWVLGRAVEQRDHLPDVAVPTDPYVLVGLMGCAHQLNVRHVRADVAGPKRALVEGVALIGAPSQECPLRVGEQGVVRPLVLRGVALEADGQPGSQSGRVEDLVDGGGDVLGVVGAQSHRAESVGQRADVGGEVPAADAQAGDLVVHHQIPRPMRRLDSLNPSHA